MKVNKYKGFGCIALMPAIIVNDYGLGARLPVPGFFSQGNI